MGWEGKRKRVQGPAAAFTEVPVAGGPPANSLGSEPMATYSRSHVQKAERVRVIALALLASCQSATTFICVDERVKGDAPSGCIPHVQSGSAV